MNIDILTLSDSAKLPERGSDMAAGYDLFADITEDIIIDPHTTAMIGTGLAVAIPEGYFGGIYARSGLSSKEGLRPANCTGVVDADYRGEIKVALHNDSDFERTITPGQKIAQMVIMPFLSVEFQQVEQLDNTDRGEGGFGSTGKM
ncbi:MAG: dUTP diphosphatase [Lachnospiraceae bacterium]|jgi:dUTP pyrophosphatase|nr:dUTP diphosphatase [Lachnospiraceae bacterium]MCR5353992.1 dUTP diphosphatase [Lachnospiraceae bacterium]